MASSRKFRMGRGSCVIDKGCCSCDISSNWRFRWVAEAEAAVNDDGDGDDKDAPSKGGTGTPVDDDSNFWAAICWRNCMSSGASFTTVVLSLSWPLLLLMLTACSMIRKCVDGRRM
jgi:hypothetical protein